MRRAQISWLVIGLAVVLLLGIFAYGISQNRAALREETAREADLQWILSRKEGQNLMLQQRVDDIGSRSYIESRARADLNYLKPGEIRFEVVNPELLDGYTEEELQIIIDEMALDD